MHRFSQIRLSAAIALGLHNLAAHAQLVINDTLTGASSSYNWKALNGACLTAGNGTGTIPACVGLGYYGGSTLVGGTSGTLPDAVGFGALRLTNGDTTAISSDYQIGVNGNNQTGAIVSNFTFPTNQGIQVTWTSVSYGGNNYLGTGADGISFFLSDGSVAPTVGAIGGSLGYSCSNQNPIYDGVIGGYIGVGIDEFGNFANPGDNTNTGPQNVPGTSASEPNFLAGRISVRGAGSTSWNWLNASPAFGKYYPAGTHTGTAMWNTCSTGYAWNYSGASLNDSTNQSIANGAQTHDVLPYNYPLLAFRDLPSTVSLANQEALGSSSSGGSNAVRANAKPITYALSITSAGILNFAYSVNGGSANPVITGLPITQSNGPLPSSFRFGFSAGTGVGSNVHEITCFKAAPTNISSSTAGTNVQSSRVAGGSQIYLAYYHPLNWWGSLTAQALIDTPATATTAETLTVASAATWDGDCVLSGGACASTGRSNSVETPASRTILSWNGSLGVPFQAGSLTTAQLTALGDTSSSYTHLSYLRGDRSQEVSNGGIYRNRGNGTSTNVGGILGDIVDSSPVWVGPPSSPYASKWVDLLNSSTVPAEGTTYAVFATNNATRTNVVYAGADDGMLHGFRAGSYSGSTFNAASNDGLEVLAYIPAQVISMIHSSTSALDFSSPSYSHNFYVDAAPGTGDLYYGNSWHTWVVSGLGPGGQANGPIGDNTTVGTGALFALDATNPAYFSAANANSLVVGEWTSASLNQTACTGAATGCGDHLGMTYGTPAIRRLHDGTWAILFGNGLNSKTGTAGLFIVHVTASGATTVQYIDTGVGSATARNGITQVTPVDLDGDHITDYVYAGDVQGNVWRFDLTGASASSWSVGSTPLFSTPTGQPITTRVAVGAVPVSSSTGLFKVIVAFGTGQKLPLTLTSSELYPTTQQALYGIWDANMSAFNAKTSGQKFDYLSPVPTISVNSNLQQQTMTTFTPANSTPYRTVSSTTICWQGSTACPRINNMMGWYLDLYQANASGVTPAIAEQAIFNPVIAGDMFIINTLTPAVSQALTCNSSPATGYTMAIELSSGGASPKPYFATPSTGLYTTPSIAGVALNATGTSSVVSTAAGNVFLAYQKNDGTGGTTAVKPSGGTGQRTSWTKLR